MESRTIKNGLFFFLFLVIILPFLQHCFGLIESGKLNGYVVSTPDVNFSYAKWWDGSYQKQKSDFVNDSVGFRPDLVRLTDQISFSLFKDIHAPDVYAGKDGQLFSKVHTDEYFGRDHIGIDTVRTILIKLKKIQDTLERLGKTMVFAYAPSKAYYVPDKIPDCLRSTGQVKTSNYHSFKRLGDSLRLNQLDFNAYFMAMKDTVKNLIFSKQGTHWTNYGALLAGDSLTKYIERARNISMPELTIEEMKYSTTARNDDADLSRILNLIFPIGLETYSYPRCNYTLKGGKNKPKTIYLGDSFILMLLYNNYVSNTSSDWEFWFYFKDVWNEDCIWGRQQPKSMAGYDWQKSLSSADCLVILFTPYNLAKFAKKDFFLDEMYSYFYPNGKNG